MLLCFLSICLCEGNCIIFDRWDTQEASVLTFYNLKDFIFRVLLCYKRNWFCEKLKVLSNLLEPQFWNIFLNTVIVITPLLLVWCCLVMLPSPPYTHSYWVLIYPYEETKRAPSKWLSLCVTERSTLKLPGEGGKWAKDIKDHF